MKKVLFFFNKLKATFWFIPVLIILFSIIAAIVLVYLDHEIKVTQDGLGKFFFVNSADSARSILSTISGAMIGVAGTVFSVTLVALTLASSQFGPRLIKNFMYVRLNQIVLGSYIATYLYCLIILNALKEGETYTFIPVLAILAAIVAAIFNIVLLIVFIHQIATSIQADNVISDISDLIFKQIKNLYPSHIGTEYEEEQTMRIDQIQSKYSHSFSIKSPKSGYLQYVDGETLLEEMCTLDGLILLHFRPGDHIVEHIEIAQVFTNQDQEAIDFDLICRQFVLGKTKIAEQDIEFSIHQMVEIASRALSPGVNDPYTAITCIDNLTATICALSRIDFPSPFRFDAKQNLRIIADAIDFEGVLNASFNQIRQFSRGSTAVTIRLMEALITINEIAEKKNYKDAILKHAKMVLHLGEDYISEKRDLQDLLKRAKKIILD